MLKDPSFVQCLSQHATADPAEYVNVVASCYGFVGRYCFQSLGQILEIEICHYFFLNNIHNNIHPPFFRGSGTAFRDAKATFLKI